MLVGGRSFFAAHLRSRRQRCARHHWCPTAVGSRILKAKARMGVGARPKSATVAVYIFASGKAMAEWVSRHDGILSERDGPLGDS